MEKTYTNWWICKDWLNKRKTAFSLQASNYGLPTPRGLLLIGIQGTGKSLTAKAIANDWQLPLLKLDVGKLFGGIVGESESRLRQMINVAETISPCILWIDEIDKAFTNTESKGDSGTSNRVLATFISWLSEKTKPVFVISTANNIDLLPLEIIRKGRFDEIFFLDLPKTEEREEIFKIHLQEFRPNSWESFDYSKLAKLSESFSGAEIKQSIIEGISLDEQGRLVETSIYRSQRIIQEFMVLANTVIAHYFKINKIYSIFRNHEKPKNDKTKLLEGIISQYKLKHSGEFNCQKDFNEIIKSKSFRALKKLHNQQTFEGGLSGTPNFKTRR